MSKFIERETGYKYTLQQNSVYEGTITTLLKHQTIYMYGTYCDSGIFYYEVRLDANGSQNTIKSGWFRILPSIVTPL